MLAGLQSTSAIAADQSDKQKMALIVNGASYHFNDADHNESNYGFRLTYELPDTFPRFDFLKGERLAAEFDVFKDSYSDTGISAGVSWTRPLNQRFEYGIKAGLLHSDHLVEEYDAPIFPYIVPFLETRITKRVDLRTAVVPPLGDITYGYMMFSLNIDIN